MASWESWNEANVIENLSKNKKISGKVVVAFSEARIDGKQLKSQNFHQLMSEMKLSYSECLEVKKFLEEIGCWHLPEGRSKKIFNDPIHGNIWLNPVCLAVIDTPQFQRLRNLKQLGLCYFVYPGAAHNRFEHSLGVCHLAGQFARTLQENQPELGTDDNDVLCLELAGLCHDLGHGPFSHLFEKKFIPAVIKEPKWKHEKASRDMFQDIVDKHGLMKEGGIFKKHRLTDKDIEFIKELIDRPEKKPDEWPYIGREKSKAYLYEIVANTRNCIDVDKWDYLARDCHQLGIRNNFDHSRFMKFARVIEVDGEMQICMRDKEILNLYNMFSTRYALHKVAYQHKVNCALEIMVAQALIKADKHIRITGKDGAQRIISECIDDMSAYSRLTDNILYKILDAAEALSPESSSAESRKDLEAAQNIIRRIFNRDLFKCIKESQPLKPADLDGMCEKSIKDAIYKNCKPDEFTKDDFFVQIVSLDFGMKEENPVEKLNVYSKNNPDEARHLTKKETSIILDYDTFKEQLVRIYICDNNNKDKSNAIGSAYDKWFTELEQQMKMDETRIKQKILDNCRSDGITENDFFVKIVNHDFGTEDKNSGGKLITYSKTNPDEAKHLPKTKTSIILDHDTFKDQVVCIYICDSCDETKSNAIERAYDKWFTEYDHQRKRINEATEYTEHEGATSKR